MATLSRQGPEATSAWALGGRLAGGRTPQHCQDGVAQYIPTSTHSTCFCTKTSTTDDAFPVSTLTQLLSPSPASRLEKTLQSAPGNELHASWEAKGWRAPCSMPVMPPPTRFLHLSSPSPPPPRYSSIKHTALSGGVLHIPCRARHNPLLSLSRIPPPARH